MILYSWQSFRPKSLLIPAKGGAGSIRLPLPCFVRSDKEHTRLKPLLLGDWSGFLLYWSWFMDDGSALGGRLTGVENPKNESIWS